MFFVGIRIRIVLKVWDLSGSGSRNLFFFLLPYGALGLILNYWPCMDFSCISHVEPYYKSNFKGPEDEFVSGDLPESGGVSAAQRLIQPSRSSLVGRITTAAVKRGGYNGSVAKKRPASEGNLF